MTYPTERPRSEGIPPWARWTIIGCAGCLTLVVVGMIGCSAFIFRYLGFRTFDASDKPDLPLSATAGQLLPPRVGAFVRTRVTRSVRRTGSTAGVAGWQGSYVSGTQHVDLVVMPTAAARAARDRSTPFGEAMQRQNQQPGFGIHMTIKKGAHPIDMVTWSKTNWTFVVESPDLAAEAFARAYQPGKPASPRPLKARQLR
jgi:hypothetical protein